MKPPLSLARHLAVMAARDPRAPALMVDGEHWSYGELSRHAAAIGAALHRTTAAPILALAGGPRDLALAAYACSAAGRAFWPLDPANLEQRWPAWTALGGAAVERLERLPAGEATPLPITDDADAPTLVIATSGSEGDPKAVMLSAANLDAAAAASNARLPLAPGDAWLACLPLHHIGGQSILWRCARAGACVHLLPGFSAETVAAALEGGGITHLSLVPAMLAALLETKAKPPRRCALIGGAPLSRPLYERATAAGWPLYPTYGMSETAAQIATCGPGDGPWQEGCVGAPLPGTGIAIDGDGRIRIRGPQVMLGYLNPGLEAGHGLTAGEFTSGDRGAIDALGRLTVLGRADDLLISGGCNVHPAEVEAQLARCPGVADVAVTALADPVWGDTLVALVVGPVASADLTAWSRAHLRPAARPRRIVHLPRLPRNALGKLERAALRGLAAGMTP